MALKDTNFLVGVQKALDCFKELGRQEYANKYESSLKKLEKILSKFNFLNNKKYSR
jgi:hypothetical protein